MAIFTKVKVGGVEFSDYQNLKVRSNLSDFFATSEFNLTLDSPFGRHADDFIVGSTVEVRAADGEQVETIRNRKLTPTSSHGAGDTDWEAQTFTVGINSAEEKIAIGSIKLFLATEASVGTVTLSIKAVDGNSKPTGADLSSGTVSILSAIGFTEFTFDMSAFTLEENIEYAMVIRAVDASALDDLAIQSNVGNTFPGGQPWISNDSGSSWDSVTGDWFFTVLGSYPDGRRIFFGRLEKISFKGKGAIQQVTLSGRDFGGELLDVTVPPVVFTNEEVTDIVTSIVEANTPDIDTSLVTINTGVVLTRIAFTHQSVYEALKELANKTNFRFWVDEERRLQFLPKDIDAFSIITGHSTPVPALTLNNTDIKTTAMRFDTTRENMA